MQSVSWIRRRIESILVVMVLGLMVVVPATSNVFGQPDVSSLVTSASANGAVSGLSQQAVKIHGNFSSSGLAQSVMRAFDEVSNDLSFVQAFAAHGKSSFSWGVGYDFKTGITSDAHVGFNIEWSNSTTTSTDSWTVFLSNYTIKGPIVSSSPFMEATTCKGNTSGDSCNWGGYEFYSGYGVGSQNAITASTANIKVPTISLAPAGTTSQHQGHSVSMITSAWVGLSPDSGGGGGLIQTGVVYNANSSTSYLVWWELYPQNSLSQYSSGDCSNPSSAATASPGDILSLTVTSTSSIQYMYSYDYNSTQSCMASYTHSETPYYAQFMVEANSISVIQQVAKFSGPVNFEGGQVNIAYFGSSAIDITTLHGFGWYNQDTLNQYNNNYNTQESYSASTGTYDTSISGYPVVTWQNSNYEYSYVN